MEDEEEEEEAAMPRGIYGVERAGLPPHLLPPPPAPTRVSGQTEDAFFVKMLL